MIVNRAALTINREGWPMASDGRRNRWSWLDGKKLS
jgi:hypothetical protein